MCSHLISLRVESREIVRLLREKKKTQQQQVQL